MGQAGLLGQDRNAVQGTDVAQIGHHRLVGAGDRVSVVVDGFDAPDAHPPAIDSPTHSVLDPKILRYRLGPRPRRPRPHKEQECSGGDAEVRLVRVRVRRGGRVVLVMIRGR